MPHIFSITFLVLIGLFALLAYNAYSSKKNYIELGSIENNTTWVYLCGLTDDFNSLQEINNREILQNIGLNLNIKFTALRPQNRCKQYNNKLCWPHSNKQEIEQTYQYIINNVPEKKITGFVGFSNGGFFLNQLAQIKKINALLVSIGSGGYISQAPFENTLYLIIGKKDIHHYNNTLQFYEQSKNSQLHVNLIEHDGKHEVPEKLLSTLLKSLLKYKKSVVTL